MTQLDMDKVKELAADMVALANQSPEFGAALSFATSNIFAGVAAAEEKAPLLCLKRMLANFESHTRDCCKVFLARGGAKPGEVVLPKSYH